MPHYQPFFIGRDRLEQTICVEEEGPYVRIQDLLDNIKTPRQSIWYSELELALNEKGVARHKHLVFNSTLEIDRFFEGYIKQMVRSLMEGGYDVDRAPEAGEAIIDANGRLLKSSSGNHRFAIARIIGLSRIPLEIVGAHEDWPGADRAKRGMRELELAIKEVSIQNQ